MCVWKEGKTMGEIQNITHKTTAGYIDPATKERKKEGEELNIFEGYLLQHEAWLGEGNDGKNETDGVIDKDELTRFFSGSHIESKSKGSKDEFDGNISVEEFDQWFENNYECAISGYLKSIGEVSKDEAKTIMFEAMTEFVTMEGLYKTKGDETREVDYANSVYTVDDKGSTTKTIGDIKIEDPVIKEPNDKYQDLDFKKPDDVLKTLDSAFTDEDLTSGDKVNLLLKAYDGIYNENPEYFSKMDSDTQVQFDNLLENARDIIGDLKKSDYDNANIRLTVLENINTLNKFSSNSKFKTECDNAKQALKDALVEISKSDLKPDEALNTFNQIINSDKVDIKPWLTSKDNAKTLVDLFDIVKGDKDTLNVSNAVKFLETYHNKADEYLENNLDSWGKDDKADVAKDFYSTVSDIYAAIKDDELETLNKYHYDEKNNQYGLLGNLVSFYNKGDKELSEHISKVLNPRLEDFPTGEKSYEEYGISKTDAKAYEKAYISDDENADRSNELKEILADYQKGDLDTSKAAYLVSKLLEIDGDTDVISEYISNMDDSQSRASSTALILKLCTSYK